MIDFAEVSQNLQKFYAATGPERVGFVFEDQTILEVPNISDTPETSFRVAPADLLQFAESENCVASWHTHPNGSSNLSGEDYYAFQIWSNLYHFIVGKDDVKIYTWDKSKRAIVEVECAK